MNKLLVPRKLLTGSLSAPLVLTVSSVGAATTSFARAFVQNPGNASAIISSTNNIWADSWFRVVLTGTQYKQNGACNQNKIPTVWVQWPTLYLGDGNFWKMQTTTCTSGIYNVVPGSGTPTLPAAPSGYSTSTVQVAALAFFPSTPDATGTPISIAWTSSTSGSTIANKSVYASVIP